MQLKSKQFNIECQEKKARFLAGRIKYRIQKKSRSFKNSSFLCNIFKISRNMIERRTNKKKMKKKKYRNLKIFPSDII